MGRRCAYLFGVVLVGVAIAAVPSAMILESYVGGSAVHGSIEDGHYFVDPRHGRPVVEVSAATWRAVYWVERLWPFSILVPGWVGMFLMACARRPDWKPLPSPPRELPPWVLWTCLASALVIVAGTVLFWYAVRIPWATMLAAWVLICVNGALVVWLYTRSLRRQSPAPPSS